MILIKQQKRLLELFILIFIYSVIYFIYTFPTLIHFTNQIIGKNDAFGILWNTYIFQTNIQTGKFWTTQQSFYPWGTSLIYHASTPLIGFLSLPFENKIAFLNILIFLIFIGSAIGAYWLAKYFITNNYFALICGFIFAFSPYKMARIEEHYPLILTAIIPFFVLFYLRTFSFDTFTVFPKLNSKKNGLILIILFIAGVSCDYVITFQMIYIVFFFTLFFYINKIYQVLKPRLFWILICIYVIVSHFLIAWLLKHGVDDKGALWWTGKIGDFVTPYNSYFYQNSITKDTGIESVMYLGYSLIVGFFLSCFYFRFKKGFYIDMKIRALLFTLFTLIMIVMPVFNIPYLFKIYSPTAILHFLPIIKNLRCPTRFINDIMLVVPIIIFYVFHKIEIKTIYKYIFASFLFILVFIEYFPNNYSHITKDSVPKVYSKLEQLPNESVLVYPLGLRDGFKLEGRFDIETMQYQTIYKKKTMGGYISRLEDWMWYVHYQNAFTNSLLQLEKDSLYKIPNADYNSAIKAIKLDYIVIPQKYLNEKAAVYLQSVIKPFVVKNEVIEGDLLISLSRKPISEPQ